MAGSHRGEPEVARTKEPKPARSEPRFGHVYARCGGERRSRCLARCPLLAFPVSSIASPPLSSAVHRALQGLLVPSMTPSAITHPGAGPDLRWSPPCSAPALRPPWSLLHEEANRLAERLHAAESRLEAAREPLPWASAAQRGDDSPSFRTPRRLPRPSTNPSFSSAGSTGPGQLLPYDLNSS